MFKYSSSKISRFPFQKYPISNLLFYLILLFLPTQFGKHFWPEFSFVSGIRVDYLSPTLYLTDILIFLLFLVWTAAHLPDLKSRITKYELRIRDKKTIIHNSLFIILISFLIIGILFSQNPIAGIYGLVKLGEFIFFGWYTAHVVKLTCEVARGTPRRSALKVIVLIFSVGIFFESFLAITQFFSQSSIGGVFYFFGERAMSIQTPGAADATLNGELILRPYGTFSHPNVLAGYLVIGMTVVIYHLSFIIYHLKKYFFIFSLALGTVALFLTMSRVAIVLWILIVGYVLFEYPSGPFQDLRHLRRSREQMSLRAHSINSGRGNLPMGLLRRPIVIGFLAMTACILLLIPLYPRFADIFGESFAQRIRLTNISIEMIKTHPFFGVGFFNFIPSIPSFYVPQNGSLFTYLQPVHNIFFLVASETGLVGLFFFCWFLFKTWKRFKIKDLRFKNNELHIMEFIIHNSLFIILIVLGMFDHYFLTIQQGQLLLSFVIGYCWGYTAKRAIITKEHVIFLSPLH